MKICEKEIEGKKVIEIENDFYKTILVPEIARFPLSFFFKVTGHEQFKQPVSLKTPNDKYHSYGGIIDSIPWVSGKVKGKKFLDKGYLYSSPCKYIIRKSKNSVWFQGETKFDYNDPITGEIATLQFRKKIIGYEGSTRLKMDYFIKNIGKTDAKYTFSIHSRVSIAKYDKGDYFYAPGKQCYVYYMNNQLELEKEGIHPPCWTKWPLKQATEFIPQKKLKNIFTFVPANWCVVGDEKYKETLFFIASPIKYSRKTDIMKMGIFMTNRSYVVEPCLTYSIVGTPKEWKIPDSTVMLKPGEDCKFTVNLVAYQGISKEEIQKIHTVKPGYIILNKPKMTSKSGSIKITGKIVFSEKGTLVLKSGNNILKKQEIVPGIFNLKNLGNILCKNKKISIYFESSVDKKLFSI